MITVQEAEAKVASHTRRGDVEKVPLSLAAGRVLREVIVADRPFPPFDRVALDGIAIYLKDSRGPRETYVVQGIVGAGTQPPELRDEQQCIEVMTGAVLPPGTNCVIPYEYLKFSERRNGSESQRVAMLQEALNLSPYENVHRRGEDVEEGTCLVNKGVVVDSHVTGMAATVGKHELLCSRLPRIAIVSTGNELVKVTDTPLPHQIRASNVHSLNAALSLHGFNTVSFYHLRDELELMPRVIKRLLEENDYLIFTGGVSKGRFDFVPQTLECCGVRKIFHGVAQKPGKPLWFGKVPSGCMVFGLPGNPMAALVCLHRYVIPSLRIFLGSRDAFTSAWQLPPQPAMKRNNRASFAPGMISISEDGRLNVSLKSHNGSGDFASLLNTHGFLEIPAEGQDMPSWSFWSWDRTLPLSPFSRVTAGHRHASSEGVYV